MNKAKLTALCAKARGLHLDAGRYVEGDQFRYFIEQYHPIDDANQADALLEKVASKLNCSWSLIYHTHRRRYDCWLHHADCGTDTTAVTQNLAKILCALRASPEVTDAEINDAMEGE